MKRIAAPIVYEDEHTMAFLDIRPASPGHTMVIPKLHARNFLELPTEEVGPVFQAAQKVGKMIIRALISEGITIGINQGRASGQEVDHLHVHIMPRWHNDGGHAVQSVVKNPPTESLDEIAKKIREA